MLKKTPASAKQDALSFDYSQAEWSAIEAAARAILPDGKPLPNEVREELVLRARGYLVMKREPWPEERRDWQRIARLAKSLQQAVLDRIEKELVFESIYFDPEELKDIRQGWEANLKSIWEIENHANEMIDFDLYRPARLVFQSCVLDIWANLGGKLQSARHPKTGRPSGPLIRFFQAVTIPVMGASAYSLESLPEIIRRHRDRSQGDRTSKG